MSSNIEHWEGEQRERNARALDAELHAAERREHAAQASRREDRIGALEAQLAGAVGRVAELERKYDALRWIFKRQVGRAPTAAEFIEARRAIGGQSAALPLPRNDQTETEA